MQLLVEAGLCYFCKQGSEEEKTLPETWYEGKRWYVMKNDFALPGSVHHYLLVPRRHITRSFDLSHIERREQGNLEKMLANNLKVSGYSMFVRNGDTKPTGATLTHLHYHFLVGGPKPESEPIIIESETVVTVILAFKQK